MDTNYRIGHGHGTYANSENLSKKVSRAAIKIDVPHEIIKRPGLKPSLPPLTFSDYTGGSDPVVKRINFLAIETILPSPPLNIKNSEISYSETGDTSSETNETSSPTISETEDTSSETNETSSPIISDEEECSTFIPHQTSTPVLKTPTKALRGEREISTPSYNGTPTKTPQLENDTATPLYYGTPKTPSKIRPFTPSLTPIFDTEGNIDLTHPSNQAYWQNIEIIIQKGILSRQQVIDLITHPPQGSTKTKFVKTLSQIGKELINYDKTQDLYFFKALPYRPHAFTLSKNGNIYINLVHIDSGLTKVVSKTYELSTGRFFTRSKAINSSCIEIMLEEARMIAQLHEEKGDSSYFAQPFKVIIQLKKSDGTSGLVMHQHMYKANGLTISSQYPQQVAKFCLDIALGLAELHKRGFVFCDFKPGNGVYEGEPSGTKFINAFLIDFGTLTKIDEERKGGTLNYLSPEILQQFLVYKTTKANIKDDTFALGASLLDMLFPTSSIVWGNDQLRQERLILLMEQTKNKTFEQNLILFASKLMVPQDIRPTCAEAAENLRKILGLL